jgi:hypothetical protein
MKKYELKVVQDESPESPREWDNVTTMICSHKRYDLGDEHNYKFDNFDSWEEVKEQIETDHKVLMIKPLYMYDHSGITISTSPFGCQWDSGQIGWVFIEEKQWISIMGEDMDRSEDRLNRIIESEVETYDKYLQGEVYQYKIYEVEECNLGHQHRTLVECCGGYFDEEDCRSEGESYMEHLEKEVVV